LYLFFKRSEYFKEPSYFKMVRIVCFEIITNLIVLNFFNRFFIFHFHFDFLKNYLMAFLFRIAA